MNAKDLTHKTIELSNGNRFYIRGVAFSICIHWMKHTKKHGWQLTAPLGHRNMESVTIDDMLERLTTGFYKIVD